MVHFKIKDRWHWVFNMSLFLGRKALRHDVCLGVRSAAYQSNTVRKFIVSCCVAAKSQEYLQFEGFVMTEPSLPQFAVHNHHSAAEDMHMLWQQIRHSKEQQTFSASSNRAALSAPTPAVWCYCSQAAPRLCFKSVYTHTYTHMQQGLWVSLQENTFE